jgi:hypothetical protein
MPPAPSGTGRSRAARVGVVALLGTSGVVRQIGRWLVVAIFLAGIAVLILGIVNAGHQSSVDARAVTGAGTVSQVSPTTQCEYSSNHGNRCYPAYDTTIGFTTGGGQPSHFDTQLRQRYVVGQSVAVTYDPDHPGDAHLFGQDPWTAIKLELGIGSALTLLGLAGLARMWLRR